MFTITEDHIAYPGEPNRVGMVFDEMPLYGVERVMGVDPAVPTAVEQVKFRLRDEDNEIHYVGMLDDDDECENQMAALRFGESDTGACIIEVMRDGKWVMEIG